MAPLLLALICGALWYWLVQNAWPAPRVFRKRRPYGTKCMNTIIWKDGETRG